MLTVLTLAAILVWLTPGRSAPEATDDSTPRPAAVVVDVAVAEKAVANGAVVIDVRTPAEYDDGHLPRTENISLDSADFDQRIAALDPRADYVVCCATGRRAGVALTKMGDAGFTGRLLNAGGYKDLQGSSVAGHSG
ncbi:rhodanese-like domain-containing protein [Nocardioides aurantiacus]|uniref:rhodanese-like domain-containing protein n=1 Tax=Nocardioides aurantiacus TaxID=86796 RepID=UPI00403F4507